jgi:hypothetical protein
MNYKQIGIALVGLGVLALLFANWMQRQPGEAEPIAETHVLAGTTTPAGDYQYVEDADYYTIEVSYPAKTTLEAAADRKVRLAIEQSLADAIAEFKRNGNFDNLTQEDVAIQGLGPERKYMLGMEYKAYAGEETVSYAYTVYEDTLGAHPNGYFMTLVFDKQGDPMTLEQVLAANQSSIEKLSTLVFNDVVAQTKQRLGQDEIAGVLFDEGLSPRVENFKSFVIDGDTLVVLIPPYQVAAYAMGSYEVRIPLAEL